MSYFTRLSRSKERSPFGVSSWNGMNLRLSVSNPKSRLSRIVNYIRQNGMSEKSTIFRDVFGKTITNEPRKGHYDSTLGRFVMDNPHYVGRNWGTYVWNLSVSGKVLVKVRKGNKVYYELGENSHKVV